MAKQTFQGDKREWGIITLQLPCSERLVCMLSPCHKWKLHCGSYLSVKEGWAYSDFCFHLPWGKSRHTRQSALNSIFWSSGHTPCVLTLQSRIANTNGNDDNHTPGKQRLPNLTWAFLLVCYLSWVPTAKQKPSLIFLSPLPTMLLLFRLQKKKKKENCFKNSNLDKFGSLSCFCTRGQLLTWKM